jgi:hypothetical protein
MDWGWFSRLFDVYERQARVAPALLVSLPIVVTVGTWTPSGFAGGRLVAAGLLAYLAISLLVTLVRDAGRRVEPGLLQSWGGMPTTQLLRHRDPTLDPITKKRFHSVLREHISGLELPTREEENSSPDSADAAYASAVAWLREATRDAKKFPLILAENASYGFRRNAYGAKGLGLSLSLLALVWNIVAVLWRGPMPPDSLANAAVGGGVSVVMLAIWLLVVREVWVKEAAVAYAHRLLAACDSPALSQARKT